MDRRQTPRADDPKLLGRRAAARARISLPATIDLIGGTASAKLLNLSSLGAMLAGADLPAAGHDVILKCGQLEIFGAVVWRDSGRCGITFDEPVDEKTVIRLRWDGDEAARRGVTPDVEQAAAAWALGV